MRFKNFYISLTFVKVVFVLAAAIVIFISMITYRHAIALNESTRLVVHTHRVKGELEQLISYLKDAETGERGYLITQNTIFLEPYTGASDKIAKSFTHLKILLGDDTTQQRNLDTLSQLIDQQLKVWAKMIDKKEAAFTVPKLRNEKMEQNKTAMDKIRSTSM